ncbi:hypothetical protein ACQKPX_24265 [Photobacterium sp. DNB23_23_1]
MNNKFGLKISLAENEKLEMKQCDGYLSDEVLKSVLSSSLHGLASKGLLAKDFDEVYLELCKFLENIESGKDITARQFGLVSYFIEYTMLNGRAPEGFYYTRKRGERKGNNALINIFLSRIVKALNLGGIPLDESYAFVGRIHEKSEDSVRRIYERTKEQIEDIQIPEYEIE